MEDRAERLVFFADVRELVIDRVQLSGDGHDARDGGTEDGEDGSFTGGDGLECAGGEVLDEVWV